MIPKTFSSIEGLRGWMAWWVVIGHAIQLAGSTSWLPVEATKILLKGDAAVNVFIIISGFVITHLLLAKPESYRKYIARRFFRLFPVYLVCGLLAIYTLPEYIYAYAELPFADYRATRAERIRLTEANFSAHVFWHLTILHGAIPESVLRFASSSILAPAWSLSLEWQFYLLAPFIVPVFATGFARKTRLLATALVCGFLFVLSKLYLKDQYQYPSMLFLSIHFFMFGILTRIFLGLKRYRASVLLIPTILLIWKPLEGIIWMVWCCFIFCEAGLIREGALSKAIDIAARTLATNPINTMLGRWSFSTYLVHIPLFSVAVATLPLLRPTVAQDDVWSAVLVAMLILPLVSWFLYRYVEMTGIRWGGKVAARLN
ncbi:MAG: acyltransferase [Aquabacterium sp.]|uniref:acyltransferase family protein n=1 Tax=Aquabacterium sp. TaxID=1872578 RepID=UPI002726A895|nr:acyltransferase [Aquabacterium sp.]MDO9002138.1 acyltransferase [Aquabacterium sp.]